MFFNANGEYVPMESETSDDIHRYNSRLMELVRANADDVPIVERIVTDQYGGLKLLFNFGLVLEVFTDTVRDAELWRFFQAGTDADHFVVTGRGVQRRDD